MSGGECKGKRLAALHMIQPKQHTTMNQQQITLLWAELCPPEIHVLKPQASAPQNVTVLGGRAFKEVMKFK